MKPQLQVTVNAKKIDAAIAAAKNSFSISEVGWVALGKNTIKSNGLEAIREFKQAFPEKKIVVDIDIIGRSKKLKTVIESGADILKISGKTPISSIEKIIQEFKKGGIEVIVDMTDTSSAKKIAKKLDELDVDYLLVSQDNMEDIFHSALTPLAVEIKDNGETIRSALDLGVEIISLGEDKTEEDIRKAAETINQVFSEKKSDVPRIIYSEKDSSPEGKDHLIDEIENRFKEMLNTEKEKIERERCELSENMRVLQEGWDRLREQEGKVEEKQRSMEKENQDRIESMLAKIENEFRKRVEAERPFQEKEIEQKNKKLESELKAIKHEWEEMEDMWRRIEEDKTEIEEKRKEIDDEWGKIEEIREKKASAKKARKDQEAKVIETELVEIQKEWQDIESIWKRIDTDREEIERKKKEISEEWENIEELRIDVEKQRENIREELKEIEALKREARERTPEIDESDITALRNLREEQKEVEKRKDELRKAEEKLIDEKATIKDEIQKLEAEWLRIKDLKENWQKEEEIQRTAGKALADLDKLKKEHDKAKEKSDPEEEKTKEMLNRLIDLVESKEEIKLKDAAKELDSQEYMVQKWSRLLEKRDIIEVKAPLLGDVVLRKGANISKINKNPG